MAHIFLIQDSNAFIKKAQIALSAKGKGCCICSSRALDISGLLEGGILSPLLLFEEIHDQDAFIRDYIDCIAGLNLRYGHHLLWWATDLSSKNRYMSQVPDHIQELVEILWAVSHYKDQLILVVNPSAAIEASLRKALKDLGVPVYGHIPAGRACFDFYKTRIKKIGGVFYNAIRFYKRSLLARLYLKRCFENKMKGAGPYYVIKTFSYDSSWDLKGQYQDVMFGRLAEFLSHQRILTWTFHQGDFQKFLKQVKSAHSPEILPVEFFLSLKDFINAIGQILFFHIPIQEAVLFRGIDVTGIVKYELDKNFNGVQLIQYLHYFATKNLSALVTLDTFLMTYENNPWERMCILAVKKYTSGVRILGYEHSVLPQASLNMFISSKEKLIVPLPDRILTVGRISMELMKKYGDYSSIEVFPTCALRYEYLSNTKKIPRSTTKRILVILDGVKQTGQFVDYLLKEMKALLDYQFIFRTHPMLPWDSLSARYGYHFEKLPNVFLSNQALPDELKSVDIVMYWQSTVALEALSLGKPLVNFSPDSMLSYDPLYGQSSLKWIVKQGDSLGVVLGQIYSLSDEAFEVQYKQAKAFIGEYFYPVTKEDLRAFGV